MWNYMCIHWLINWSDAHTYLCWPFIHFKSIHEAQIIRSKLNFNSVTLSGLFKQVVRSYYPKYLQGKAIRIQACCRRLWLPEFLDNWHTKVETYQLYTPVVFTTRGCPRYLHLIKFKWTRDRSAAGSIASVKNPSDPIGNKTLDVPTCSTVP